MKTDLYHLQTRFDALEQEYKQEIATLRFQHQQSTQRYCQAERRLKIQAGLAVLVVSAALLLSPANRAALAQTGTLTLQQLAARLSVVEGKTQFMTASAQARSTVFSGCNLFIQNGLGATNGLPGDPLDTDPTKTRTNGLGNLIVGYNERLSLIGETDIRTGSHNIIVGQLQNYSSFGGLVAGQENAISGPYASITGGEENIASGASSSISGGVDNIASGVFSSIGGGAENSATHVASSISGGINNIALGDFASISGGIFNTASGRASAVSGGENNTVSGINASVSGGSGNVQRNRAGWSGGAVHSP